MSQIHALFLIIAIDNKDITNHLSWSQAKMFRNLCTRIFGGYIFPWSDQFDRRGQKLWDAMQWSRKLKNKTQKHLFVKIITIWGSPQSHHMYYYIPSYCSRWTISVFPILVLWWECHWIGFSGSNNRSNTVRLC